ncbi:MAG: rRNA maturation RNase YbeY [Acetobacteraceae bacterium]|nr:rRNA maturation RNase YbeY [Acetobacteraceae bacterium]
MGSGSRPPGGGFAPAGLSSEVDVLLEAPGWLAAVPDAPSLARRAVAAALAFEGMSGHLTLLLSDDAELKRLNGGFRGKEKATNVLSFPAPEGAGTLGDLAIALGTLRREAAAEGRTMRAHFAHLVVHGTLHLLGHDHLSAGEARRMEQAEARILHRLGFPNPWKHNAQRTGSRRAA